MARKGLHGVLVMIRERVSFGPQVALSIAFAANMQRRDFAVDA